MPHDATLRDFTENPGPHLLRLRSSGMPERLDVGEGPPVVVQDQAAYEALLDRVEHAEAVAGIRSGLADAQAGRVIPLAQFREEMRRRADEVRH